MDRYNIVRNKNQREIVLLKAFPCVWGKCTFCDYIEDNSRNEDKMVKLNNEVLSNITGEAGVLEVINSGSVFELPKETLVDIKRVVEEKGIKRLFFESHWCYRNRLNEIRDYFGIPITFKTGIETFDESFRNDVLNKKVNFKDVEELKKYFDSVCLMVGIKGQTKEMIDRDMEILLNNFNHGTINIWTENTTKFKRDNELLKWFADKYGYLENDPRIEVLFENTDFGVGE